jgi:hypothetical protein
MNVHLGSKTGNRTTSGCQWLGHNVLFDLIIMGFGE